jgi:hypothetical protein
MEKVRIWSIKGLDLRASGGTPKIFQKKQQHVDSEQRKNMATVVETHMRENLLGQLAPLRIIEALVKTQQPSASF